MRLAIVATAIVVATATSLVAFASVFAQGQATVAITASADEQAVDWDIGVAGGTSSIDHITLGPTAVGLEGDFTVSISGSKARVTLTTAPTRKLASVGCLDDLTPPTEITPVIDGSTFTLDVVPGGRYECFVSSVPAGVAPPAAAAPAVQLPTRKPLPRSDTSATESSMRAPGWGTVLVALIMIAGAALLLRPARPRHRR
jgi:hypothetical protein